MCRYMSRGGRPKTSRQSTRRRRKEDATSNLTRFLTCVFFSAFRGGGGSIKCKPVTTSFMRLSSCSVIFRSISSKKVQVVHRTGYFGFWGGGQSRPVTPGITKYSNISEKIQQAMCIIFACKQKRDDREINNKLKT